MLIRQFIKFGIVGLSNTALSYIIYAVLVYLGLHYIVASVISFMLSVLNSFYWNKRYVFVPDKDNDNNKDGDNDPHQQKHQQERQQKYGFWGALLKTYASYALTGFVLQNILLFVFISALNLSEYIAPLLSLAVTVPLNFVLNKKWAFK